MSSRWTRSRRTRRAPAPSTSRIPSRLEGKKKRRAGATEEPVKKFGPGRKPPARRLARARPRWSRRRSKPRRRRRRRRKPRLARSKPSSKLAANKLEMERRDRSVKRRGPSAKRLIAARNVGGQGSGRSERDRSGSDRDRDPTAANGGRFADTGDGSSRGVARSDDRARGLRSGIRPAPAGRLPRRFALGPRGRGADEEVYPERMRARAAGSARARIGSAAPCEPERRTRTRRPREPRSRRRSTPRRSARLR